MTNIPSREEVQQIIAEQEDKIMAHHEELSHEPSLEEFSFGGIWDGVKCTACKTGLNVAIGAPIAAVVAIVVVATGPIDIAALAASSAVVAIASAVGLEATSVATIIVGVVGGGAAGGAAAVEEIIGKLCEAMGAC